MESQTPRNTSFSICAHSRSAINSSIFHSGKVCIFYTCFEVPLPKFHFSTWIFFIEIIVYSWNISPPMTAVRNAMDDFEIPIPHAAQIFLNSGGYISSTLSSFAGFGDLLEMFLRTFYSVFSLLQTFSHTSDRQSCKWICNCIFRYVCISTTFRND